MRKSTVNVDDLSVVAEGIALLRDARVLRRLPMAIDEARIRAIERRLSDLSFEHRSQVRELRTAHDYMHDLRADLVQRFDDISQWRDSADQRLENIERKLDEIITFLHVSRGSEPSH